MPGRSRHPKRDHAPGRWPTVRAARAQVPMPSLQSTASVLATDTASANSFGHPEHGKACRIEGAKQGANSDRL